MILELVRETKGREELEGLQFPSERRKIECARKHFQAVGVDYRVITDQVVDWWRAGEDIHAQPRLYRPYSEIFWFTLLYV